MNFNQSTPGSGSFPGNGSGGMAPFQSNPGVPVPGVGFGHHQPGAGGNNPHPAPNMFGNATATSLLYKPQSEDEKRYYEAIFSVADIEEQGKLSGRNAVAFMGKSELPRTTLGEIWVIVDVEKKGFLTVTEFFAACRLMGLAQNGMPHTLEQLQGTSQNKNIPLVKFSGVNIPVPSMTLTLPTSTTAPTNNQPPSSFSGSGSIGGGGIVPVDDYSMSEVEKQKYFALMDHYDADKDGFIDGRESVEIFRKSNLSNDVLGRIWNLVDVEKRGKLNKVEFSIGFHLILCVSNKKLELPHFLPASLAYEIEMFKAQERKSPSPQVNQTQDFDLMSGNSDVNKSVMPVTENENNKSSGSLTSLGYNNDNKPNTGDMRFAALDGLNANDTNENQSDPPLTGLGFDANKDTLNNPSNTLSDSTTTSANYNKVDKGLQSITSPNPTSSISAPISMQVAPQKDEMVNHRNNTKAGWAASSSTLSSPGSPSQSVDSKTLSEAVNTTKTEVDTLKTTYKTTVIEKTTSVNDSIGRQNMEIATYEEKLKTIQGEVNTLNDQMKGSVEELQKVVGQLEQKKMTRVKLMEEIEKEEKNKEELQRLVQDLSSRVFEVKAQVKEVTLNTQEYTKLTQIEKEQVDTNQREILMLQSLLANNVESNVNLTTNANHLEEQVKMEEENLLAANQKLEKAKLDFNKVQVENYKLKGEKAALFQNQKKFGSDNMLATSSGSISTINSGAMTTSDQDFNDSVPFQALEDNSNNNSNNNTQEQDKSPYSPSGSFHQEKEIETTFGSNDNPFGISTDTGVKNETGEIGKSFDNDPFAKSSGNGSANNPSPNSPSVSSPFDDFGDNNTTSFGFGDSSGQNKDSSNAWTFNDDSFKESKGQSTPSNNIDPTISSNAFDADPWGKDESTEFPVNGGDNTASTKGEKTNEGKDFSDPFGDPFSMANSSFDASDNTKKDDTFGFDANFDSDPFGGF